MNAQVPWNGQLYATKPGGLHDVFDRRKRRVVSVQMPKPVPRSVACQKFQPGRVSVGQRIDREVTGFKPHEPVLDN